MTLSNYLKSLGLTISYVQQITGRSRKTLYNWYEKDRDFFNIVISGCIGYKPILEIDLDDLPF